MTVRGLRALAAFLVATLGIASLSGCLSLRPYAEVRASLPAADLISVAGRLVHVEQRGPVAAEPLVLVHGFGASTYSWRFVAPELSQQYRTIAIDLAGFGATERPNDFAAYTREGQVAMLLGVLDALGIERAHWVGHSYGGALSLTIAARHPERVRSLILIDSAAPTYPEARRRRFARSRVITRLALALSLRESFVRRGLAASYFDDSLATAETAAEYLARLRVEGVAAAYRGLTAPNPNPGPPVDLTKIETPTLMIWGEQDELVAVEGARVAAAQMPNAKLVELPQTGHSPMEERPTEVLGLAFEFLARNSQKRNP